MVEPCNNPARESHRQYATLEDLLGEDLAALMEARVPATQRRWPLTPVGSAQGLAPWGLDYTGWLHLLRAALTLLLPDECDGQAQPIRITQIKQRLGVLVIHHVGRTALRRGVCELVERISGHTCMKCGHPGRPRGGWIASAVIVTAVETVPQVFTLNIRTEDCDCRAHGRSLPSRDRAPGIVGFQLGQSGVRPDVRECPGLARVRLDTGHVTCMRAGSHS